MRHSKKPPEFFRGLRSFWVCAAHDGSALLFCHAAPARDARLHSASGKSPAHFRGLRLFPSRRSIRAAHDGSALPPSAHNVEK